MTLKLPQSDLSQFSLSKPSKNFLLIISPQNFSIDQNKILFFINIHSQGSNNSDQSSGYLSGSGGSNSLPPNANPVDHQSHYDFKYGQTRLDNVNDQFHVGQEQQQKNDHRSMKKLSLTSSINDYTSLSSHEQDMDYNSGHK